MVPSKPPELIGLRLELNYLIRYNQTASEWQKRELMITKVYNVFRAGGKLSTKSIYSSSGTTVNVAAKSVKQAYYLCDKQIWFNDETGVGIIELESGKNLWWHCDGKQDSDCWFGVSKAKPLDRSYLNTCRKMPVG
jgi:hypothetical protein